jgi:LicD family
MSNTNSEDEKAIQKHIDTIKEKIWPFRVRYYPCIGIYPETIELYTPFTHDISRLFFQIMESMNQTDDFEYYVFAGSAVGYVRDKKNIPWVDDYDIIVFEEHNDYFLNKIVPKLLENKFYFYKDQFSGKGHKITYDHAGRLIFLCDIFISYVNDEGFVRDSGECGMTHYTKVDVPLDMVKPAQYVDFDGMYLPFFNKVEEETIFEYGDVRTEIELHFQHIKLLTIHDKWENVYAAFNTVIKEMRDDTYNQMTVNNRNYCPDNELVVDSTNKCNAHLPMMYLINDNNVGYLRIKDMTQCRFIYAIKEYFPECKITLEISVPFNKFPYHHAVFHVVDRIVFTDQNIMNTYTDPSVEHIEHPKFRLLVQ